MSELFFNDSYSSNITLTPTPLRLHSPCLYKKPFVQWNILEFLSCGLKQTSNLESPIKFICFIILEPRWLFLFARSSVTLHRQSIFATIKLVGCRLPFFGFLLLCLFHYDSARKYRLPGFWRSKIIYFCSKFTLTSSQTVVMCRVPSVLPVNDSHKNIQK